MLRTISKIEKVARLACEPSSPLKPRLLHSSCRRDRLWTARLTDRSTIAVEGDQTFKVLQGLVTNDVRRLEEQIQRQREQQDSSGNTETAIPDAFYCSFLNPQGKVVAPVLLHGKPRGATASNIAGTPSLLLDCHADSAASLKQFIKRFSLRSKIKLKDAKDEWDTYAIWSDDGSEADQHQVANAFEKSSARGDNAPVWQVWRDARTPELGWRLIAPASSELPTTVAALQSDADAVDARQEDYLRHRAVQGVPDGPHELAENKIVPLEANIDLMGGVDYKKGCYVGQELTSRTHHLGVVRKRIMPVTFMPSEPSNDESLPTAGQDVRTATPSEGSSGGSRRSKSAGSVLSVCPPKDAGGPIVGLALLRLQHVLPLDGSEDVSSAAATAAPMHQLDLPQPDGKPGWKVQPSWPKWWPPTIKEKFIAASSSGGEE